jgi:hypothetical protein
MHECVLKKRKWILDAFLGVLDAFLPGGQSSLVQGSSPGRKTPRPPKQPGKLPVCCQDEDGIKAQCRRNEKFSQFAKSGLMIVFWRFTWSGWRDSNSRPPAPKAGTLANCATPRHSVDLIITVPGLGSILKLEPRENLTIRARRYSQRLQRISALMRDTQASGMFTKTPARHSCNPKGVREL